MSSAANTPSLASRRFGDWIPCSEALPEDQVSVLVISKRGKQAVMYRERGVWVLGLTTSAWEPTHWMPLPPGPDTEDQMLFGHNPAHPVGTCVICGAEMSFNVPRLGPQFTA